MEIKSERNASWHEAKKILMEKENKKELVYEQQNAIEHLRKFCKLPEKKYIKMVEELSQIGNLREKHIINIVNFMPCTPEEIRILFANERIVLSDSDKKKIMDIVKENK